jgi:hypothetical protein
LIAQLTKAHTNLGDYGCYWGMMIEFDEDRPGTRYVTVRRPGHSLDDFKAAISGKCFIFVFSL